MQFLKRDFEAWLLADLEGSIQETEEVPRMTCPVATWLQSTIGGRWSISDLSICQAHGEIYLTPPWIVRFIEKWDAQYKSGQEATRGRALSLLKELRV